MASYSPSPKVLGININNNNSLASSCYCLPARKDQSVPMVKSGFDARESETLDRRKVHSDTDRRGEATQDGDTLQCS